MSIYYGLHAFLLPKLQGELRTSPFTDAVQYYAKNTISCGTDTSQGIGSDLQCGVMSFVTTFTNIVYSLSVYVNFALAQMSTGVSRLKDLAVGLGDEIGAQNDQLDRIAPKVERADTKIRDQNRQMRHILGK